MKEVYSTPIPLVIYADGKYGCVANPADKVHQKEIFAVAGGRMEAGLPTKINVETFQIKDTHVVMNLGRFGRFFTAAKQRPSPPQQVPLVEVPAMPPGIAEAASKEEPLPPSAAPSLKAERPSLHRPPLTVAGVCLAECCQTSVCAGEVVAGLPPNGMSDEITAFLATPSS